MTDLDPSILAAIAKVLDSTCQDFPTRGDQESRSYIFAQLVDAAREGRDLDHAVRNALAVVEAQADAETAPRGEGFAPELRQAARCQALIRAWMARVLRASGTIRRMSIQGDYYSI